MEILIWMMLGAIIGGVTERLMHDDHNMLEDIVLGVVGGAVGGIIMSSASPSDLAYLSLYSFGVAIIGSTSTVLLSRVI